MGLFIEYKDYVAKLKFADDTILGRVVDIPDFLQFHADSIPELIEAFHETIDDYLALKETK